MSRTTQTGLIIFDADGVLVDSEPITNRLLAECVRELGIEISDEAATARFRGSNMPKIIADLTNELGAAPPESFATTYRARMHAAFERELQAIPGAEDAVRAAIDMGHQVCVASSGPPAKLAQTLSTTNLIRFFEDNAGSRVYSAHDIGMFKPDPGIFLHASTTLGVPPARCIVIEDSAPGIEGALRAHMTVLAYTPDGATPEIEAIDVTTFSDMRDAPALIEQAFAWS